MTWRIFLFMYTSRFVFLCWRSHWTTTLFINAGADMNEFKAGTAYWERGEPKIMSRYRTSLNADEKKNPNAAEDTTKTWWAAVTKEKRLSWLLSSDEGLLQIWLNPRDWSYAHLSVSWFSSSSAIIFGVRAGAGVLVKLRFARQCISSYNELKSQKWKSLLEKNARDV
jgi:hypothetical protein